MTKSKKRYDSKYKVTRIHLGDYLALKRISQLAEISMAEALHRLIEHQAQLPLLDRLAKAKPVAVATQPVFRVKSPVILRARPEPILTTNGQKAGVFVTKPKGGIFND